MVRVTLTRYVTPLVLSLASLGAYAQEPIKIGIIEPLTGPAANVGTASQKSLAFFIDQANAAGGVLGRKFELVSFDNKASPQETLVQFKALTDQGIQYIYQNTSSAVGAALLDAVTKHNNRNPDKPVLQTNGGSVEPSLTNSMCHFYFFRFYPHSDMSLMAQMQHLKTNKNAKKVFLLNQDYSFGQAVSATAKKLLKDFRPDIQVVGDELVPLLKVQDFSPQVAKIKASGADTVITGNWGSDLSLFVRAADAGGLKVTFYTQFAGAFGSPAAIGNAGNENILEAALYQPSIAVEQGNKKLEQLYLDYKKVSGMDLWFLHHKTMMDGLIAAMKKVNSTDPNKVAYALEGMEIPTELGAVSIGAHDHQSVQPLFLSQFVKGAKYDVEKSGMGWKTILRIEGKDTVFPSTCNMKRPPRT